MEVANAAETNGASFLQRLRKASEFFYLPKLRDAATSLAGGLWGGAFRIQEEEEAVDLEAGAPEAEEEETNVRNSIVVEKALVIVPPFPASVYLTLPGLLSLAQIKWQVAPSGFPSPTLHKWYIVCVTTLLTEFLASVAQWIISSSSSSGQ